MWSISNEPWRVFIYVWMLEAAVVYIHASEMITVQTKFIQ